MQKNNQLQWDSQRSAFKQKIYFVNGKKFTGYSRNYHFRQSQNELENLCNMIARMFKAGYLDPNNNKKTEIIQIEYFDQQRDSHLFDLFYDDFRIIDKRIQPANTFYRSLFFYLQNIYKLIKAEMPLYYVFYFTYDELIKDEFFILNDDGNRFADLKHLEMYCKLLIDNNYFTRPEVEKYYKENRERYTYKKEYHQ